MNTNMNPSTTVYIAPDAICERERNHQKSHANVHYKFSMLISLMLLWSASANASLVIYDNGANPPTNGPVSDISPGSQTQMPQIIADDFALLEAQNITDIHWTGTYFGANSPVPDLFSISVCNDASGSPGICSPLSFASSVVRGAQRSDGFYDYSVDVNPFFVNTAVHWLTIFNNTVADPNTDWLWGATLGGNATRTNENGPIAPWTSTNLKMDFQLTGVPEPGKIALLSIALLAFGVTHRHMLRV